MTALEVLKNGLVVSCQPVDGGPMDDPLITAAFAKAAVIGGASGLRIEGLANLGAVRSAVDVPIIGIIKRYLKDSPVRITPFQDDVADLAAHGADIIAYDATARARPTSRSAIVKAILSAGKIAMADCATIVDAQAAIYDGAQIIGTTLSGYAYDIAPDGTGPDFKLISEFYKLRSFVMAEGRLNTPKLAEQAMRAGADCVTIGSAITRAEHITGWFDKAVKRGAHD
jgi:N-acylglucosamine-6-phosphate 2-epimerase